MLKESEILLGEVKKILELLPLIERIGNIHSANFTNLSDLVDSAFAFRQVEDVIETFLKKLRSLSRNAEEGASIVLMTLNQDKISTQYCTASTNPRLWYNVPHKRDANPEQFDDIMEEIGVPREVAAFELVRFNMPALMDYCSKLAEKGEDPPGGIDAKKCTGVELRLRIRKKMTDEEETSV